MPSKDDLGDMKTNDMVSHQGPTLVATDVDQLVYDLKENLRLTQSVSLKARPTKTHGKTSRPSPYRVPCRSWSEPAACDSCMKMGAARHNNGGSTNCSCTTRHSNVKSGGITGINQLDDPYETLQVLIKNQSLIREAVRRIQVGLAQNIPRKYMYSDSDEDCDVKL